VTPAPRPLLCSRPGARRARLTSEGEVFEQNSATGSCVRCQRPLDLASVKLDGEWYCRASCAAGVVNEKPRVSELALINRPRRYWKRRAPKELRRAESA